MNANFENTMKLACYISGIVPILKKADSVSAEDLIQAAKNTFTEFGLPKKVISDNFKFCMRLI